MVGRRLIVLIPTVCTPVFSNLFTVNCKFSESIFVIFNTSLPIDIKSLISNPDVSETFIIVVGPVVK